MATDVKNDASLSTNLVSYWELEETSGTRYDSHGSNNLADNNTVGSATGIQGNGADFEISDTEYLSITDAAQTGLEPANFTLSAWVKVESMPAAWATIAAKNYNGTWNAPYVSYFLRLKSTGELEFISAHSGGSSFDSFITTSAISSGSWYHLAIVYDGSYKYTYINGSYEAKAYTQTIAYSTGDFNLGRDNAGDYFDGIIDEVGFWSRALTSGEITALYNSGAGIPYDAGGAAGFPFSQAVIIA